MSKLGWSIAAVGFVLQIIARLTGRLYQFGLVEEPIIQNDIRLAIGWGGTLILTLGLYLIVRTKGRCWAWSLLSLFNFVGMIVVGCLKRRDAESAE